MREPSRLCDGDQLPSALRDAFRALEREAPNAEMVARVQQALHALPAAAPGAVTVAALSGGKLLALVTLLVGSVASLALMRGQGAPKPDVPAVAAALPTNDAPAQDLAPSSAAVTITATKDEGTAAAASARTLQASAQSPSLALPAEATGPSTASASVRRSKSAASKLSHSRPVAKALSTSSAPLATASAETSVEPEHATDSAPEPSAAAAQAAEARLLAQAKRLAAHDPQAALRQVEALAAQYPYGVFAQERSLLAIQLHRQLGHSALAEQLTRQFQERYPRSLYRRALPP